MIIYKWNGKRADRKIMMTKESAGLVFGYAYHHGFTFYIDSSLRYRWIYED